jgi:hypothetical protein
LTVARLVEVGDGIDFAGRGWAVKGRPDTQRER